MADLTLTPEKSKATITSGLSSQPLLMTVLQVQAQTGLSRTTIYELMASGRLGSVAIGRSRRIPSEALVKFVNDLRSNVS